MMWRYHFDLASGCAGWNGGRDLRTRHHGERGRRAVKSDAGRPCQIRSQDLDSRTNLARRRQRFYEWPKAHGQAKNRAIVVGSAPEARPIKLPISALGQPGRGEMVKAVKSRQLAFRSHFESRASVLFGSATGGPV